MTDKNLFLFKSYLQKSNYEVSKEIVSRFLSDSSNFIASMTNTLDFFGIKNLVANVPKNSLEHLPKCFIAQINHLDIGNLVLVTKKSFNEIELSVDNKQKIIISNEKFIDLWTGLILAIDKNVTKNKKSNFSKYIKPIGLIISLLLFISYLILVANSIIKGAFLTLSFVGLFLSYFIYKEKTGHNTILSKYCKTSRNSDCQKVLKSNGANLIGNLDLSDAAFVYFVLQALTYVLEPNNTLFFYLSALSLIAVFYSIYQQLIVIKQWCPLCLGIVLVLILQFFILFLDYSTIYFDYSIILILASFFGLILIFWKPVKEILHTYKENDELIIENLSFRRSTDLFVPYYIYSNKIETGDKLIPQIQLGSRKPKITITAITSPVCGTCFDAHTIYTQLLKKYPNDIQINFRFFVASNNSEDPGTQVSERLLELYFNQDRKDFLNAFNEWYGKISLKKWLGKWGKCQNEKYNEILNNQVQWCHNVNIDSTPTILINGKLFPKLYSVSDLDNFISDIIKFEEDRQS